MNNDVLKGLPLQVNWNVRDPAIQKARNANIILKNLDKSIDEKTLRHICTRFGKITSAKVSKPMQCVLMLIIHLYKQNQEFTLVKEVLSTLLVQKLWKYLVA